MRRAKASSSVPAGSIVDGQAGHDGFGVERDYVDYQVINTIHCPIVRLARESHCSRSRATSLRRHRRRCLTGLPLRRRHRTTLPAATTTNGERLRGGGAARRSHRDATRAKLGRGINRDRAVSDVLLATFTSLTLTPAPDTATVAPLTKPDPVKVATTTLPANALFATMLPSAGAAAVTVKLIELLVPPGLVIVKVR